MLTVARFWQERPLVEIKDSEELKAWLRGKPREVASRLRRARIARFAHRADG